MRQKRRSTHPGGPRMRPYDSDAAGRMELGAMKGLQWSGYDYPIRKLRTAGGTTCVTLPLQVRDSLELERGHWLVFGSTPWRGVAAFVSVTAKPPSELTPDDRRQLRQLTRKVQRSGKQLCVTIPPEILDIIAAVPGDLLIFGLTAVAGAISVCVVKGGGESTGSRRSG